MDFFVFLENFFILENNWPDPGGGAAREIRTLITVESGAAAGVILGNITKFLIFPNKVIHLKNKFGN